MQNLLYNISQVLGITIIHSFWQGLMVFIVLRLFVLGFPGRSAVLKYWVAYGSLVFMLGWFVITLFNELGQYNWLSTTALQVSPLALPVMMDEVAQPANKLYFGIAAYMPWLTMIYVVGVVFNALRLTLAWNNIYRIRQNISDAGLDSTMKRLTKSLQIGKHVQAAFSDWVDVPCVTGFLKPIILMPVSITCHLSVDEVEAVLLHGLAHVKRHDYLLNFIQQVIGILLFFNPFARLVGKIINQERENCCDDIVVRVTGSPFIYAQALLKLEENKQHQWQLALAATTKKYELLNRIERIMKTKTHTVNIRPVLITLLALTFSISSIAWLNPEIKDGKVVIKNAPAIRMIAKAISAPEPPAAPPAPTVKPLVKHKKHISIQYLNDTTKANADTIIKHKKYKIVVEDENGMTTEYNSVKDLPMDDKKEFFKNSNSGGFTLLPADSGKFKALFQGDGWKEQQKAFEEQSKALGKQFSNLAWKKQLADVQKSNKKLEKYFKSKAWQKKIAEFQGSIDNLDKMDELFESDEFKKLAAKNSDVDAEKFLKSQQWQDLMKDMGNITADASLYLRSPEYKKELESLKQSGADMDKITAIAKYYGTGEGKKQFEKMNEQLKKATEQIKIGLDDIASEKAKQAEKDARKAQSDAKVEQAKAHEAEQKDLKEMMKKLGDKERAKADSATNAREQHKDQ